MAKCYYEKKRQRYVIRFYDQNGRRGWETMPKDCSAKVAKKRMREIEDSIERRTFRRTGQIPTFGEVAAQWLEAKKATVRHFTWHQYRGHVANHLNPFFGSIKTNNVTLPLVERFVSHLVDSGMFANTARKVLVTLGSIMSYATSPHRCYASSNPVPYIKNRPKRIKQEAEMATFDEIQAIIDQIDDIRDRLIVRTTAIGGLRMGEIFGLQWGDIQWRDSQVYVRRSFNHGQFHEPKSERSKRTIDIPEELLHELKEWKLAYPNSADDLVFCNPSGRPEDETNWLRRVWHPARRRAGIRHLTPHSLRHFSGSFLLDQGQTVGYVQDHLGHSSVTMTMDIYRHKIREQNRGAAKKFGKVFYGNGCKTGAIRAERKKSTQAK